MTTDEAKARAAARTRLRAIMAPGDGRGWRKFWHRVTCSHCFGSGGGPEHLWCDWCDGKGDVWERKETGR